MRAPTRVVLIVLLFYLLWRPMPALAHANPVRAEPAIGSAVATAPAEIRVWFGEAPEPRYSEIRVYDAARERYDQGGARPIGSDPSGLAVALRPLPEGTYTVVWRATSSVDGHSSSGSFAFAVGVPASGAPVPPASGTEFVAPTAAEVAARWAMLAGGVVLTGLLALRALVWAPAVQRRGPGAAAVARRVCRRLVVAAAAALPVLVVATAVGTLLQATRATADGLDAARLGEFLFATRAGGIWLARLALPLVGATVLGPFFLAEGLMHADPAEPPPWARVPALFGVALGAGYLLTLSLTSHTAASASPGLGVALDFLHSLAAAVWLGGVTGLVLTVPLVAGRGGDQRGVLAEVVARFSALALLSVAVLAVTGLYSAWTHVGSLAALWTDYGRMLTVKLGLFAVLVALGAFNVAWVRPRLAGRDDDRTGPTGADVVRRFGRALRLEALLGAAVLLVVAVLTGLVPGREAIASSSGAGLARTADVADLRLTLTLASREPGANTFDLLVRRADTGAPLVGAERVTLRIAPVDAGVDEVEVVAAARGDGHYLAAGPFLSMAGRWQVRPVVRRAGMDDATASFSLAIGGSAEPDAPAPAASSARYVALALVAVAAVLTLAGARWRRRGGNLVSADGAPAGIPSARP